MLGKIVDALSSRGLVSKRWRRADVLKVFEELEVELLSEGMPLKVLDFLKEEVSRALDGVETKGDPKKVVKERIKKTLLEKIPRPPEITEIRGKPAKLIFFGFNGVGKSLSIVKVARYLIKRGFLAMVISADTFRAAAGDQLEGYARIAEVPVFKGPRGADPAAVAYDGISSASSKGYDYVLIDTAGRNYMDRNLVEELRKVVRVSEPDLKVLVLDGLSGSDMITQCDSFEEAVGIDALIVTKVDASSELPAIIASFYTGKPVLFLGIGQGVDDLKPFDPQEALDNLL